MIRYVISIEKMARWHRKISVVLKSFEAVTEGLGYIDSIEPFVIVVDI